MDKIWSTVNIFGMGQPRIILFNFIIFKHKYDRKNCRIRMRFVGLEGNYADHLATITTASPGSNFDSFSMKTSKNDKRSSLNLINLFDHERRRWCAWDSNLGLQDGDESTELLCLPFFTLYLNIPHILFRKNPSSISLSLRHLHHIHPLFEYHQFIT